MATERKYEIIVDATTDMTDSLRGRVHVIEMQIQLGEETIVGSSEWNDETSHRFYDRLRDKELPTTSQITPYFYEMEFERFVQQGVDVLYLCLSSGLSNTIASAHLAASNVLGRHPEANVVVFDTRSATYGETLMLEEALSLRDQGRTLVETAAWLDAHAGEFATWFIVGDLMYLRHGGRISSAAALLGSTFRIMPIMHIDDEGKLPVYEKVQGRKSAVKQIVRELQKSATPHTKKVYIIHADVPEEAEFVRRLVAHALPEAEAIIGNLGPVIGGHVGPATLALAFRGAHR